MSACSVSLSFLLLTSLSRLNLIYFSYSAVAFRRTTSVFAEGTYIEYVVALHVCLCERKRDKTSSCKDVTLKEIEKSVILFDCVPR